MSNENHPITALPFASAMNSPVDCSRHPAVSPQGEMEGSQPDKLPFCRKTETLDKAQLALEAVPVQDEGPKPRSNRARDAQTR